MVRSITCKFFLLDVCQYCSNKYGAVSSDQYIVIHGSIICLDTIERNTFRFCRLFLAN